MLGFRYFNMINTPQNWLLLTCCLSMSSFKYTTQQWDCRPRIDDHQQSSLQENMAIYNEHQAPKAWHWAWAYSCGFPDIGLSWAWHLWISMVGYGRYLQFRSLTWLTIPITITSGIVGSYFSVLSLCNCWWLKCRNRWNKNYFAKRWNVTVAPKPIIHPCLMVWGRPVSLWRALCHII